ncbi:hypothetical protein [Pseudonocardia sp. NPDC049635]|uniref:hypothetical protein n=1 Tax=Pseudonocardia sp. NPDC049635 TaxID=3155506 RepID=UPI0033D69EF1
MRGLVPVTAVVVRRGLEVLLTGRLTPAGKGTANATEKVIALVAGIMAGGYAKQGAGRGDTGVYGLDAPRDPLPTTP